MKKAGITDEELAQIPPERLNFNEKYAHQLLGSDTRYMNADAMNEILEIINSARCHDSRTREDVMETINSFRENKLIPEFEEAAQQISDFFDFPKKYTDDEVINLFSIIVKDMINSNSEINTVIQGAVKQDFKDFISDTTNKYGQTNARTEEIFKQKGLDFNQWQNPDMQDVKINSANKDMTIKLWERNPQEDLFMGNKTSCCTATDGKNGAATPSYLLNKSYNIIQLYDDKTGEMYGMSRVYMADVNGKPSLMMDNIELNNIYFKDMTDEQEQKVRNGFFEYAKNFADKVTGKKDTPVYFSTSYVKVKHDDLDRIREITDFIGEIAEDSIYVNAAEKDHWFNPKEMKNQGEIEWYVVK